MPDPKKEKREKERLEKEKLEAAKKAASHPTPPLHDEEEWDDIDEAAWESFPASDPPSHWAGADRRPDDSEAD